MQLPRTTGQTVARDLDWFFRRDGSRFPVSYVSLPIELPEGRGAVVVFADIGDRLRAEQVLGERDAVLGSREDSLRRIAALVAGGAGGTFRAIAGARVVGLPLVVVWRYASDGTTATVIGASSEGPHPFQPGTRWPLHGAESHRGAGDRAPRTDRRLQRAPRHDRRCRPQGRAPCGGRRPDHRRRRRLGRDVGQRHSCPAAGPRGGSARRVQRARRHGDLEHREQGWSRPACRGAGGVAAGRDAGGAWDAPEEVFAAVADEVGRLLSVDVANVIRYESDDTVRSWRAACSDGVSGAASGAVADRRRAGVGT